MLDIVIIFSILNKEKTDHYYSNYFFLHISFQLKRIPHFNIRQQRVSVLEVKYSMEAPLYIKGKARNGPTFREAVLVHAVARLVLHPFFKNIQTSWVKMGPGGIKVCLQAGVNDLGGTLMNESITRAAGTIHGQEMPPVKMEGLIKSINRIPQERSTLYGVPLSSQRSISKISFRLEQDSFSKAS